jgi:YidC/Oxa1 family membrane protein insertase
MNILIQAFNTLLYQPLFNALILLYNYLPGNDFGLAVITLTFLLRLFLYPVMTQSIKYQQALNEMQPRLKEIQEKYKEDKEQQAKEIMSLYKEKRINPLNVFLPLLIQLPLLIALFQVFKTGLQPESMNNLYTFVAHPGEINYLFLGLISLSEPSLLLAAITSVVQFFQFKKMNPKQKTIHHPGGTNKKDTIVQFSNMAQKQMPYFLSAFTFAFLTKLPAALGLYWITTSLFSIGQQHILKKHDKLS